jgi:hypothetical protein
MRVAVGMLVLHHASGGKLVVHDADGGTHVSGA